MARNRIGALAAALVLALAPAAAAASQWRVDEAAWAQPRSGAAVLGIDAVAEAVTAWSRATGALLVIRYPGGAAGSLRAAELHDWLVALGVPSRRIERVPGGVAGGLGLDVRDGEPL